MASADLKESKSELSEIAMQHMELKLRKQEELQVGKAYLGETIPATFALLGVWPQKEPCLHMAPKQSSEWAVTKLELDSIRY